jgi:hypothetical protein
MLILAIIVTSLTINREELLGNVAFSIFPISILLNISIIFAFFVEKGTVKIVKAAWVFINIAVIIFVSSLFIWGGVDGRGDSGIVLAYSMLTLSFPIGNLAAFIISALLYLINFGESGLYISYLMDWGVFFVLGYLQWFKLVPWIIGKVRARVEGKST